MKWHRLENICFSSASKQLFEFCHACNKDVSAFILFTRQPSTRCQPQQPQPAASRPTRIFTGSHTAPQELHHRCPHSVPPWKQTKPKGIQSTPGLADWAQAGRRSGRTGSQPGQWEKLQKACSHLGSASCWMPRTIHPDAEASWSCAHLLSKTGSDFLCSTSTLLINPVNLDN